MKLSSNRSKLSIGNSLGKSKVVSQIKHTRAGQWHSQAENCPHNIKDWKISNLNNSKFGLRQSNVILLHWMEFTSGVSAR